MNLILFLGHDLFLNMSDKEKKWETCLPPNVVIQAQYRICCEKKLLSLQSFHVKKPQNKQKINQTKNVQKPLYIFLCFFLFFFCVMKSRDQIFGY